MWGQFFTLAYIFVERVYTDRDEVIFLGLGWSFSIDCSKKTLIPIWILLAHRARSLGVHWCYFAFAIVSIHSKSRFSAFAHLNCLLLISGETLGNYKFLKISCRFCLSITESESFKSTNMRQRTENGVRPISSVDTSKLHFTKATNCVHQQELIRWLWTLVKNTCMVIFVVV